SLALATAPAAGSGRRRARLPHGVGVDMLASPLVAPEKFALGGGWRTVVRGRRADVSPVFLTTDRILELAHPLPERTPHLREALRAEHEQRDNQDDDHPSHTRPRITA